MAVTVRKKPERMCCGCNEMKPKAELVRLVKSPPDDSGNSEVSLDLTGKKPGRGAYICKNINCFNKARKTRRFERTLSCKISDEVFSGLQLSLKNEMEIK